MCICVWVHVCRSVLVTVRGQLPGVSSLYSMGSEIEFKIIIKLGGKVHLYCWAIVDRLIFNKYCVFVFLLKRRCFLKCQKLCWKQIFHPRLVLLTLLWGRGSLCLCVLAFMCTCVDWVLCMPHWSWTTDPPASISQVLELVFDHRAGFLPRLLFGNSFVVLSSWEHTGSASVFCFSNWPCRPYQYMLLLLPLGGREWGNGSALFPMLVSELRWSSHLSLQHSWAADRHHYISFFSRTAN